MIFIQTCECALQVYDNDERCTFERRVTQAKCCTGIPLLKRDLEVKVEVTPLRL